MSASTPSASSFRKRSARLLVGAALLCVVLLVARLHLLAALSLLVAVAIVGAVRRVQDKTGPHGSARASQGDGPPEFFPTGTRTVAERGALEAKLDAQWSTDQESSEPTSLLLIRVDALDALDTAGGKGAARPSEVAMLTLAGALARMLPREADLLARYDKSTFAVVLCGTDLAGSLRVAARLRWAIVRLGIANPRTASGFLSASMGVSTHHGPATGKTAVLIASAEKMLGVAQRVGEDSLEYEVLGVEPRIGAGATQQPSTARAMPAIRAWTPERATALHSPQA